MEMLFYLLEANMELIRVFCETTKFLEVFLIRELISRSLGVFFRKSPRPYFLIKRAVLGNLKASFHCTHLHRFFPLKRTPPLAAGLAEGIRG